MRYPEKHSPPVFAEAARSLMVGLCLLSLCVSAARDRTVRIF